MSSKNSASNSPRRDETEAERLSREAEAQARQENADSYDDYVAGGAEVSWWHNVVARRDEILAEHAPAKAKEEGSN